MGLCVETKEELRMASVNVVTQHTNYFLILLICDDNDGKICDYKDGGMFSFMKIDIMIAVNVVTQYTMSLCPAIFLILFSGLKGNMNLDRYMFSLIKINSLAVS